MSETFCCMVCRLLQTRSPACIECGAQTMISLETGSEGLRFGNLNVGSSPQTRREKIANATGTAAIVAGYAGVFLGGMMWWPAIPIILGAGVGGIGVAAWRRRQVPIADVELLPVATANGAVEKQGIARKLSDTVKSVIDAKPVLVEQIVVGHVKLRRTNVAPFLVETDGERFIVAGTVRITSGNQHTLKRLHFLAEALGVPPRLPLSGPLEIAQIRDGDRVAVKGVLGVEMLPELAFHRDAGEVNVMRGTANAVIAIRCEEDV